jgi:hypothetical protein
MIMDNPHEIEEEYLHFLLKSDRDLRGISNLLTGVRSIPLK